MTSNVSINQDQELYVIKNPSGYSCLGFDVCIKRRNALAKELSRPDLTTAERGSLDAYQQYQTLTDLALSKYIGSGKTWRSNSDLVPQFIGHEGKRVEVTYADGEVSHFTIGKSTGWVPCHLEIKNPIANSGSAVYLPDNATFRFL